MKSRTELFFYLMLVISIAILAGIAVYATSNIPFIFQTKQDVVPRTISALPRVRKISGYKAIDYIQQLLYGYDFNLEDGTVAIYGNQNVILWFSDAGSEQKATNLLESMKVQISEEGLAFRELGSFELLDFTINELDGFDHLHYYWQASNLVIWLTVDAAFAGGALSETVIYYQ